MRVPGSARVRSLKAAPLVERPTAPQHFEAPGKRELRAQAVQRLLIGLFGLAAMLLLVALANIIMERARMADAAAGLAAAHGGSAANGGGLGATADRDPLADLGVVPAPDASGAARRVPGNRPAISR